MPSNFFLILPENIDSPYVTPSSLPRRRGGWGGGGGGGGDGGRTATTIRGTIADWCSEGQLCLTPRTSPELNVQTPGKSLLTLLLSEAVQLFPFPYELPGYKKKMCTCPYQAQSNSSWFQSELVSKVKFSISRSRLWATSYRLELHVVLYTIKSDLLGFFPDPFPNPHQPQPQTGPPPHQFVRIMRMLHNLHSNMKSARGIIPMAGALSERSWAQAAQLQPCSRASTGVTWTTPISFISFLSPSLLRKVWVGGMSAKTLMSCYVSLSLVRKESHCEPPGCK